MSNPQPTQEPDEDRDQPERQSLTFLQLLSSTLAAAFGVQSSANRKRDFANGKPGQFIAMGVIFTALFVLTMIVVVKLVLSIVS